MTHTFIEWLALKPQVTLSQESMTKVCIITDINKMHRMVNGININSREFDYMYDMPLCKLQEYEKTAQLNTEAELRWKEYQKQIMRRRGDGDAD
jgi:hypothetical protein